MAVLNYLEGISLHAPDAPLFRNIISLRESEDLMDDLSDVPEERDAAHRLEMQTKPHPYGDRERIIQRPFDEADWFNAIQFPFEHWQASRFSEGRHGVWYGAGDLDTTVYETCYHWRSGLLADAGWESLTGVSVERSVYHVDCKASLLDFTQASDLHADLRHPSSYGVTQDIGRQIHREGHPGLISLSARCDGLTYAVFNPEVLSNPANYCYLTYTMDAGAVIVERAPGETLLSVPFAM